MADTSEDPRGVPVDVCCTGCEVAGSVTLGAYRALQECSAMPRYAKENRLMVVTARELLLR